MSKWIADQKLQWVGGTEGKSRQSNAPKKVRRAPFLVHATPKEASLSQPVPELVFQGRTKNESRPDGPIAGEIRS